MKTQKSFFTKAFFIALALVFTFGLSACGKKTNRPADANVNLNIRRRHGPSQIERRDKQKLT